MPNLSRTIPFKKLPATKAWKLTSEYVRLKANGRCYTCDKPYPFAKLSAGHLIEKIGNAGIYFDLDGLRPQCFFCNRRRHGAKDIYTLKLLKEIGEKRIKALYKKAQKSKVWTKEELDDIAEEREFDIIELEVENKVMKRATEE